MTTWIPVTDHLPDDLVSVWVTDNKTVGISEYMHGHEQWSYCDSVAGPITQWMPLPEFPKVP